MSASPVGLLQAVCIVQDLHAMATACCRAAQLLHTAKLVHRDLRLPNVVQLGPQHYMVIDLESVADLTAERKSPVCAQNMHCRGT